MDKAIEKFVDILPRPIIISSVAIFILAWVVKESKQFTSYLEVFKELSFLAPSGIIIFCLLTYYINRFVSEYRSTKFSTKERGVVVAEFEGDAKGQAQLHTIECIKSAIYLNEALSDVSVKKTHRIIHDHNDASSFCRTNSAALCIWGTFIEPSTIHYCLSTPNENREARATVITYPDITVATNQVVRYMENTPPKSGSAQAQIKYLGKQLDEQLSVNSQNAKLIQGLTEQVTRLQTEVFGRVKFETQLTEIKRIEKRRRRIALIIGNSQYQSLPSLRFPIADATAIANTLNLLWGNNTNIHLLENATGYKIHEALNKITTGAAIDDQVWLYYSGHAVLDADRKGYILPCDGNPKYISASAISMSQIGKWFNELKSKQAIMFVDACYSGAFGRYGTKASLNLSLDMIKQASGRVIITAGGENDFAFEDQTLGHSIFTHYLLKGLMGEADIDNDGLITAQELYEFLYKSTVKSSSSNGFRQQPTMFAQNMTGDFVLAQTA